MSLDDPGMNILRYFCHIPMNLSYDFIFLGCQANNLFLRCKGLFGSKGALPGHFFFWFLLDTTASSSSSVLMHWQASVKSKSFQSLSCFIIKLSNLSQFHQIWCQETCPAFSLSCGVQAYVWWLASTTYGMIFVRCWRGKDFQLGEKNLRLALSLLSQAKLRKLISLTETVFRSV